MENTRIVDGEGVQTIVDEKSELIGIIRRDPVSGKHLVYLTQEATSTDLVELIHTDKIQAPHEEKKL